MSHQQCGFEGDNHDVFAVVKPYMHSRASKQPSLVLPQDRAAKIISRCPGVLVDEEPMAQDRRDELLSWADKLELPRYDLHEAASLPVKPWSLLQHFLDLPVEWPVQPQHYGLTHEDVFKYEMEF